MRKSKEAITPTNAALLNILAPMGLEFKRNQTILGEHLAKTYGIIKYPPEVSYGWLAKITNLPGTLVTLNWQPIDAGGFTTSLSKNIIASRAAADSARDPLMQKRAEKAAEDGERILIQIDQRGESVGLLSSLVMPLAKEESDFEKLCRKVESTAAVLRCKLRSIPNLQKEAFQSLSPFYPMQPNISQVFQRVVPLSSFIGGFPFAGSGYNDGVGDYLGIDSLGGMIVVDPWRRADDFTNSNMVITGVAGVGKSTVVKHIICSEYKNGTRILMIDPEREYKELCKNLGGDWINAGGSASGRINPLQVRPWPVDEESEEEKGMGDLALHLKNLDIFFSLYIPSLTDMHKAVLKKCLISLYENFGINWTTVATELPPEKHPTMADLLALIKAEAKENAQGEQIQQLLSELALLLKDISEGSDQWLWNGHTTIHTNNNCVCLDTLDLQNTDDNIKRAQYFNLLTWCWQEMSKDRTERVLLICDEAYLMIDPNVPQSLVFLRNAIKRDRKYEAGIMVIFHSVVDCLDPAVKMYGQALLDIPAIKILMGTDGKNLQETQELYHLTEAETDLLAAKKRQHGLLMIGSKRLHINFELPDYKFRFFGSAGGR